MECIRIHEGQRDPVSSVAFSRDSELLASGSLKEDVRVLDISSGKCLRTLEVHSGLVMSVIFPPDSRLLASASLNPISENGINVWDVSTGNCLQTLHDDRDVTVKSFDITNSYLETDNYYLFIFNFGYRTD
jgi:WD40 repeat protein